MDAETERRHYLNHPFSARYVRLHPMTWRHGIGLRAALLGCPHKAGGDCGPGFFHVNAVSGCSTFLFIYIYINIKKEKNTFPFFLCVLHSIASSLLLTLTTANTYGLIDDVQKAFFLFPFPNHFQCCLLDRLQSA